MNPAGEDPHSPTPAPVISVVLINHNAARWLPEAIDSVLAQTGVDFEVIIADDASTDESPQVIQAAAARDRRIVPLLLTENLGISGVRNRGWEVARGEYISLLDSDDRFLPDTLATQLATYLALKKERPDLALLSSDAWLINEKGERAGRYISTEWWGAREVQNPPLWTLPSSWFFPRDLPVRFCEAYREAEAPIFLARVRAQGGIAFLGEPILEYRLRLSSTSNARAAQVVRAMNAAYQSDLQGRLADPLLPHDVPVPSWRQVGAWLHGRNAKAAAINGRPIRAIWETLLAAIADPKVTLDKLKRYGGQKLRR